MDTFENNSAGLVEGNHGDQMVRKLGREGEMVLYLLLPFRLDLLNP